MKKRKRLPTNQKASLHDQYWYSIFFTTLQKVHEHRNTITTRLRIMSAQFDYQGTYEEDI